jgi:carbonic anhydrase
MKTFSLILMILGTFGCSLGAWAAEQPWSYEDTATQVGPQKWGTLPGDELCGIGKEQTPINFDSAAAVENPKLPALRFEYKPAQLNLENNGHTIKDKIEAGSDLIINGTHYALHQFHFHASSEHSVDGKFYPMEIHFVHDLGQKPVVIGVFIQKGKHNAALDPLLKNFPKKPGEIIMDSKIKFDASNLLPKDLSYFNYKGSLTTPPCGEGLDWYVLRTPITMDAGQIRAFTAIDGFAHTHRPIQPLGSRSVEKLTRPPSQSR